MSDFAPVDANGIRSGWERVRAAPRDNVTETRSWAASAHADLLDNLLVATAGIREDRADQAQAEAA